MRGDNNERAKERRPRPAISAVLPDGRLAEMVYAAETGTSFVVGGGNEWTREEAITLAAGERLVPYSPRNNLLLHEVVLLPSDPEEYGSVAELVADIRAFIHRYVDLSPLFEEVSS